MRVRATPRSWLDAPVLYAGVLVILATSRWGSFLHVPGVPFYIGDAIIVLALGQAVLRWRSQDRPIEGPAQSYLRSIPLTGWLVLAYFTWAMLRFVTRTAIPMVAVRDLAPYFYAVGALLTFLWPVRSGRRARIWIYAALTIHAAWYSAVIAGLIDQNSTWRIASTATLFSTRPDFDAAVFGIALAFAVHQIAFGPRPKTPLGIAAFSAFLVINIYPLTNQRSRSGLLAAGLALTAVVGADVVRHRAGAQRGHRAFALRIAVSTGLLVAAVSALLYTVPGQRLIGGFGGGSEARGTSNARVLVSDGISRWLLDSPVLTTFGVGYGPNMLARSKTVQYLEGTEFTGVRSPHNYLLGTWARLGLIGALLAVAIFVAAGRLALLQLTRRGAPADTLAALVLLTIPVVAIFGVVLESPFGAIPYFWAVGQLCAGVRRRQQGSSGSESLSGSESSETQSAEGPTAALSAGA